MPNQMIRDTIARVAAEEGIDPAYALAVAERESGFDPNARASKSIAGLFQMTGALRRKYGAGDSADPVAQTRAFAAFTRDLQNEMRQHLGRDPTYGETYLGHYWGGARAARVIGGGHDAMAPSELFSPYELSLNPELAKGRSSGALAASVIGDIDRRRTKFGGSDEGDSNTTRNGVDFASFGEPRGIDFSAFGQQDVDLKVNNAAASDVSPSQAAGKIDTAQRQLPGAEVDLAQFGIPETAQPQPIGT